MQSKKSKTKRTNPHTSKAGRAKSDNAGAVRIIGGTFKRTIVPVPDSEGLRPTPDRVRESLFNWLGQDVTDWVCVDAFAGTGVLALEAVSRGAAQVFAIEYSASVAQNIRTIQEKLDVPNTQLQVWQCTAEQGLKRLHQNAVQADVVFLDPPFAQPELLWGALRASRDVLLPDGLVYVETPLEVKAQIEALEDWRVVRSAKAGNSFYALLSQ